MRNGTFSCSRNLHSIVDLFGDQYSNFNTGSYFSRGLAGLEYSLPEKRLTVRIPCNRLVMDEFRLPMVPAEQDSQSGKVLAGDPV